MSTRLNTFCTGYARDSSAVAREAVKHAAEEGYHCVLIDTAGRMQVRSRTASTQGVEAVGEVLDVWIALLFAVSLNERELLKTQPALAVLASRCRPLIRLLPGRITCFAL